MASNFSSVFEEFNPNDTVSPSSSSGIKSNLSSIKPRIYLQSESATGITVRIRDQERRDDDYVVYCIEIHAPKELAERTNGLTSWTVFRRFSEFDQLRRALEEKYPGLLLPPLPDKAESYKPWRYANQKNNSEFILARRQQLESFLRRLLAHSQLGEEDLLLDFLKEGDSCKGNLKTGPVVDQAVGFLKRASAQHRVRNPPIVAGQLRLKASQLHQSIMKVLDCRRSALEHAEAMHQLHGNYTEMMTAGTAGFKDNRLSEAVQTMGHVMSEFASLHSSAVSEESEVEGMLSEYLRYADSLLALCGRVELAMVQFEAEEDRLRGLEEMRTTIQDSGSSSGFSLKSLRTRLKGYGSPAEREHGLARLEADIEESRNRLELFRSRANQYTESSADELARFEATKREDLQNCLRAYAEIQLRRCQRAQQMWTQCKEAFSHVPI